MESIGTKQPVTPSSQDLKEKQPVNGAAKRLSGRASNRNSKEVKAQEEDLTDMLYLIDVDTEAMCLHQLQCVNVLK